MSGQAASGRILGIFNQLYIWNINKSVLGGHTQVFSWNIKKFLVLVYLRALYNFQTVLKTWKIKQNLEKNIVTRRSEVESWALKMFCELSILQLCLEELSGKCMNKLALVKSVQWCVKKGTALDIFASFVNFFLIVYHSS